MQKSIEIAKNADPSMLHALKQQEKIQKAVGSLDSIVKTIAQNDAITNVVNQPKMAQAFSESDRVAQTFANASLIVPKLQDTTNGIQQIDELTRKVAVQPYQFDIPAINSILTWDNQAIANMAAGLKALTTNPVMQEIQLVTSNIHTWLQLIDSSPLRDILEKIRNIGLDYNYNKVNEIFLKAMFDAKWFPYAGWLAEYSMTDQVLDILNTSRSSKSRTKKIDKLIFGYYNKKELDNIKRRWRQMGLPSYMIRILVQSVQAYNRKEYALTVSALSTLWEGIIQEKINDNEYRISKRTRENLKKLIEDNGFEEIFSSFCAEFIFYDCRKPSEVKPDVPGRHGIAHSWYDTYPNKKMALNAILFTDFLLQLIPLDQIE